MLRDHVISKLLDIFLQEFYVFMLCFWLFSSCHRKLMFLLNILYSYKELIVNLLQLIYFIFFYLLAISTDPYQISIWTIVLSSWESNQILLSISMQLLYLSIGVFIFEVLREECNRRVFDCCGDCHLPIE